MEKIAYNVALTPNFSNLYDVFHVSQLRKYISDLSHVILIEDIQVRDNLTVESVEVIWEGATGEKATWEPESKMREGLSRVIFSSNF